MLHTRLSACSLVVLLGGAILVACSTPQTPPAPRTHVRLTTGLPGAGFHPLGAGLAAGYTRLLPGLDVEVQESPGSVRNVQALHHGTADLGLAFADVAYVAYVGELTEEPVPFDDLRGIAVLQLTPLHLLLRPGSAVRTVDDLRGKRIGTGPPGSGTALTSHILMRAFGLVRDDVKLEMLAFNEATARLIDGTLDAAFVNGDYPSDSVLAATRAGARLLPIAGPDVAQLRLEYPFLRLTFIPAGTYPAQDEPVATIGVDTLLVCRADLGEDVVYDLTKALFSVLSELAPQRTALRTMDIERAPATPIPLHEGAARYYRERELTR